jgi:hypothetical protein
MFYHVTWNTCTTRATSSKPFERMVKKMHCLSTGSGAVLDVTEFDKKNKLLQGCNKKHVTKFIVTNYLLQLLKNTNF